MRKILFSIVSVILMVILISCSPAVNPAKQSAIDAAIKDAVKEKDIAEMFYDQSNYEDAIEHFTKAIDILATAGIPEDELTAELHLKSGLCYESIAIDEWLDSIWFTESDLAKNALNIINFFTKRDELNLIIADPEPWITKALSYYNRAVVIYKDVASLQSAPQLMRSYAGVAQCVAMRGDVNASVKYMAEAKNVLDTKCGVDDIQDYEGYLAFTHAILSAVNDYTGVQPYGGTLDDFKALIDAAM